MKVTVIYPSDSVGGTATVNLFFPKSSVVSEILEEVRSNFSNVNPDGLPKALAIRTMLTGDVIRIEQAIIKDGLKDVKEDVFIVTPSSFRLVAEETAQNWLRRTLVERMVGSGMHAKISGEHAGVKTF